MISEHNAYAYCIEDISLIENYKEAVNSPILWQCHHRLEIELNKSADELIAMGLYYHRPASELIFLTVAEHSKLHQSFKTNISNGEHLSEEHKKRIGDANRGKPKSDIHRHNLSIAIKNNPNNFWLGKKFSDEHKKKIRESNIGRPAAIKGKHKVWNDLEHTKYHFE